MTLSDKVANGKLLVIDSLVLPEAKTKVASAMLKKLPLGRKTLVVIESENKLTPKAVRNIVGINPVSAKSLNLLDVLNNDTVVVSKAAIEILEKTYTK